MKHLLLQTLTHLMTGILIRLFWFYENSIDIRVYGLENLRLNKRAGLRPMLTLWHGKGFLPIAYFHNERLCLYASHSRDPNYNRWLKLFRLLTLRMIERMGYMVLDASQFASESRGVLKYVQILREERGGAIAADGPQGPIYQAKPGACFLAKKSGVILLPVGSAIESGVRLDQWDAFEIPYPFTRAVLVVEEPIIIPSDAGDAELEKKRLEVEEALNRATCSAEYRLKTFTESVTTKQKPAPAPPAPPL
jgi:lysophospholipid acyltransferase (LPLAT)-like uncharacterized protein